MLFLFRSVTHFCVVTNRIQPRGDRSVFLKTDSPRAVYKLLRNLPDGILDVVPALGGIGIHYDPRILLFDDVRELLETRITHKSADEQQPSRIINISVQYDGPDLDFVAEHAGISVDDVIALHVSGTYQVAMIGFAPGFAYLTGLDQRLITPRRETPRTHVDAGSVGIGGEFTGVYPVDSPGGWQLIGKTTLRMFDAAREDPTLLRPGDVVRFVAA